MYCKYWNLHKAPFDNVPDPSMYADCHTSMENVISDTIFAIKEANEAFAVIIGAVGLGKTLSLRIIIDSLELDKYKVVLITNPSISFTQLLREIIGQITGKQCQENRKVDLLEIFNHLLFATRDRKQKIVIFIDEANAISPANLENLRLLTNMQDDQRNLFTLVLAGQLELAQRLEHPKRANLFQRIDTYGRIDKIPSEEAVRAYIETRLKLAGTNIKIFSDDCINIIWEYSQHGVPRLINKICKLCLQEGETNNFDYISADVVLQIAERFQKLSNAAVQERKPRTRPDIEISDIDPLEIELEETCSMETIQDKKTRGKVPEQELESVERQPDDAARAIVIPDMEVQNEFTEPETFYPESGIPATDVPTAKEVEPVLSIPVSLEAAEQRPDDTVPVKAVPDMEVQSEDSESILQTTTELDSEPETFHTESEIPVTDVPIAKEFPYKESISITNESADMKPENKSLSETITEMKPLNKTSNPPANAVAGVNVEKEHLKDEQHRHTEDENYDEVIIGEYKIQLNIPKDILKQVKSFNRESANKSAGFWAAQIIKKNPQLTHSPLADPVYIWNEIRDNILKKIAL